ncbi:MAG: NAD(P)-dependent oxidoreductase [Bryobacterales bacterium]
MFHVWTERALPADITAAFDGLADMIGPATDTPEDPLQAIPAAHGIIAAGGVFGPAAFDRAVSALVLSRTGIGYDKIDVPAATERGIAVCNTPDAPTISTAEFALALLLSAAKKLKTAEHALMTSENKPRDYYKEHEAIELYGRRLGLVGFGRIGRYVAKVAQAMGMVVAAYDPFVEPAQAAELGVELRPKMADVLADADFVSLHLPLSSETYRIVNADVLAQFKRGAMLINASRGGLVDEAARGGSQFGPVVRLRGRCDGPRAAARREPAAAPPGRAHHAACGFGNGRGQAPHPDRGRGQRGAGVARRASPRLGQPRSVAARRRALAGAPRLTFRLIYLGCAGG